MVIGEPQVINQKWRYRVEVDGYEPEIGFSKAGPLEVEVANLSYKGGGRFIPHKEPGMASFASITLEKGSTEDEELYNWFLDVVDAASDSGLNVGYKRNITITQLDREGLPVTYWRLYEAFPVKFTPGEWDSGADEFLIESVELEYDFFEREAA